MQFVCLITCFCDQLIAKPGNQTAALPWLDPYDALHLHDLTHMMHYTFMTWPIWCITPPWLDPYDALHLHDLTHMMHYTFMTWPIWSSHLHDLTHMMHYTFMTWPIWCITPSWLDPLQPIHKQCLQEPILLTWFNLNVNVDLRVFAIWDRLPYSGWNKGKHPLIGWCESRDHLLASGRGFQPLMPASDLPTRTTRWAGVFLLYRTYLWIKQVKSINLITWSTMQYHMVVDHIVFYVIHSQVWYNLHNQVARGPFHKHGSNLIPIWINTYWTCQ